MYRIEFFDKDSGDLILSQDVFASSYGLVVSLAEEVCLGLCLDHSVICFYKIKEV